jgi:Tfp pilus assembly protein PilN
MQAVNLLPKELVGGERSRLNLPLLGAGMVPVVALGLVIHGYGGAHSRVGSAISELSSVNAQVAEIAPARVREAANAEAANEVTGRLAAQREARLTALRAALATAPPLDTFLDRIARVLPSTVWLTSLNATPSTSAAAGTFAISGYTYSDPAVAQLLARLQLLPDLTDVTLTSATTTTVGEKSLSQFTITATPTGGPAPTTPTAPTTSTP